MSAPDVAFDGERACSVIGRYVENYEARQAGGAGGAIFAEGSEANAVAAVMFLELAQRFDSTVPAVVAAEQATRLCRDVLAAQDAGNGTNIAGFVLERVATITPRHGVIRRMATSAWKAGSTDAAIRGVFGAAWRTLLLGLRSARQAHDPEDESTSELDERLRYVLKKAEQWRRERPPDLRLYQLARVSTILAITGECLNRSDINQAATDLAKVLTSAQLPDGSLRDRLDESSNLALSAHLAEMALAMGTTGFRDHRDACLRYLLDQRFDDERSLIYAADPDTGKLEFSPWIPWALTAAVPSVAPLEQVLDPRAVPLPDFVVAIPPAQDAFEVDVSTGSRKVPRRFDGEDLNALLSEIVSQVRGEADELSPRLLAHLAIGLESVLENAGDDSTRSELIGLVDDLLNRIVADQETNGGWRFGRANVPSVIYGASGARETKFPDLQYTIDTSVPGIALGLAHLRTGNPEYRGAAIRAFRFFEESVGRIDWEGHRIWLLYPDDNKTPEQGTAVNYEAWAGYFFAVLSRFTHEPISTRARAYVDDVVTYAAHHLQSNGDIAYGDYVRELRTPYASWDAYLLTQIAQHTDNRRARRIGVSILERLNELQLPNGSLPNVVDYEEEIAGDCRWMMHRHGIGPYPMRSYYLLYYVAACAAARVAHNGGLAAFAFVLATMYEPVFTGMSSGFYSDGRFDDRPDSLARVGRDWLLLALASLGTLSSWDYRPQIGKLRQPTERFRRELERLIELAESHPNHSAAESAELARARARLRSQEVDGVPEPDLKAALDAELCGAALSLRCATRIIRALGPNQHDIEFTALMTQLAESASPQRDGTLFAPVSTDGEKAVDIGLHAEVVAALAAIGSRDKDLVALVEGGLELLASRLSDEGLWTTRESPARRGKHQGTVLVALGEVALSGAADEAGPLLQRGVDGSWDSLIHHGLGRGYATAAKREPMPATEMVAHVRAFVTAHLLQPDRNHLNRARSVLRYLLHTYRDATGAFVHHRLAEVLPRSNGHRVEPFDSQVHTKVVADLAEVFAIAGDLAEEPPILRGSA